jgi:hypothetical protein
MEARRMTASARALGPLLFAIGLAAGPESPVQADDADLKFFETRIRPVLSTHCFGCHSAKAEKLKANLFLDSREGILRGGDQGPAVVPGEPEKSRLLEAIRYTNEDLQMPPKSRLPESVVADVAAWIRKGAPWPKEAAAKAPAGGYQKPDYEKLRKEHWAWQRVRSAPPPAVRDASWPLDDLDRFVLAELEAKGLRPVAPADRAALLRRLSFDLTGLPPTPEEITAFENDLSAGAYEKVVDRLLASSAFGERWGRHWLDVARYADSCGSTRNYPYPHAWRYRDYVIASFNADKPFDRFVREQIAGDLLPAASPAQRDEQRVATGFLVLGTRDLNERVNEQYLMDAVDDQIDSMSRAVLGLTVSCARCHDHKFDPIPTADYYALAGIFRSTVSLPGLANRGAGGKQAYERADLLVALGTNDPSPAASPADEDRSRGKKGKKAQRAPPAPLPAGAAFAMGVRDGKPEDARILARGEVDQPGAAVPRGVLSLFKGSTPPAIDGSSSGRRQLAEWLTRPENPLTARVLVNRVWKHLFGEGLVPTVDNFGVTGEPPSHPELLDHLATRFMKEGWSVKRLIRALVLSRTYRLGSDPEPALLAVDPANRLLWRAAPRRLEAEALRDAILAVSGTLDRRPPAGSPVAHLQATREIGRGQSVGAQDIGNPYRTVYQAVIRDYVPDFLVAFDFADPGTITGRREVTTVATQALFLMNSGFVVVQSRAAAGRLLAEAHPSDASRVDAAYLRMFARKPTAEERARALAFLEGPSRSAAWAAFCQALFASAEFRYLNVPPERRTSDVHPR